MRAVSNQVAPQSLRLQESRGSVKRAESDRQDDLPELVSIRV